MPFISFIITYGTSIYALGMIGGDQALQSLLMLSWPIMATEFRTFKHGALHGFADYF
jgi:hypothetical protein